MFLLFGHMVTKLWMSSWPTSTHNTQPSNSQWRRRKTRRLHSLMCRSKGQERVPPPQYSGRKHTPINTLTTTHDRIKSEVIQCLTSRAEKICHSTRLPQECQHLRAVFQATAIPHVWLTAPSGNTPTPSPQSTGPAHPPPTLCQRCKWKNWASVQTSRDQNHLQVSGNSPWSPGPHKTASTSTEEKGVVHQVPCAGCDCMYIGETGRTLEKRLSDHRGVVKRNTRRMALQYTHAWKAQYKVDWEAATVKQMEMKGKIIEAIYIKKQKVTSNLDCGLNSVGSLSSAHPSPPPPPTKTT